MGVPKSLALTAPLLVHFQPSALFRPVLPLCTISDALRAAEAWHPITGTGAHSRVGGSKKHGVSFAILLLCVAYRQLSSPTVTKSPREPPIVTADTALPLLISIRSMVPSLQLTKMLLETSMPAITALFFATATPSGP